MCLIYLNVPSLGPLLPRRVILVLDFSTGLRCPGFSKSVFSAVKAKAEEYEETNFPFPLSAAPLPQSGVDHVFSSLLAFVTCRPNNGIKSSSRALPQSAGFIFAYNPSGT